MRYDRHAGYSGHGGHGAGYSSYGGFGDDANAQLAAILAKLQRMDPSARVTLADLQATNPAATQADVDSTNAMTPQARAQMMQQSIAAIKAMMSPQGLTLANATIDFSKTNTQGQPLVTPNAPSPPESHWGTPLSYHGVKLGTYRPGQPFDWSGTIGFAAGAVTAVTIWGGFWPAMLLGGVGAAIGHNFSKKRKTS